MSVGRGAAGVRERITGAGWWSGAVTDEIDCPDPRDPRWSAPRPRAVGWPRCARSAAEPSPEMVERPTTDVAAWHGWWARSAGAFDARGRYRHGRPYTPALSLHELDVGVATVAERRALQRELVIRTGAVVRFDPRDFVRVQEMALEAWVPEGGGCRGGGEVAAAGAEAVRAQCGGASAPVSTMFSHR